LNGYPDTFLNNASSYRYGYNGMEKDDEVSGTGNSYTTEFRQYDPRVGRWKSLDPLMTKFPWMSPFVAFDNNPIYFVDPYGLASEGGDDEGGGKDGDGNPLKGDGNDGSGESKGIPSGLPEIAEDGSIHSADNGKDYINIEGSWSHVHEDVIVNPGNEYKTSGDVENTNSGGVIPSTEINKGTYKSMVYQFDNAKNVVDKIVTNSISGIDGVNGLIMTLANIGSSGGDLYDITPMDLLMVPGASMLGEELSKKWDSDMLQYEMTRAGTSWSEMKSFASKRNTDAGTIVIFVYAAKDIHGSTIEMLNKKIPTTTVYKTLDEAQNALGFVPSIVYYKFLTPSTTDLIVLPMNKLIFK